MDACDVQVAVLIACHKDPESVYRICRFFSEISGFICIIHIDKKSKFDFSIVENIKNVFVLPEEQRIDVEWGAFSQVEATLALLNYASNFKPCFFWFISGQDMPIKNQSYIQNFFKDAVKNKTNFVDIQVSKFFRKRNAVYYPKFSIGPGKAKRLFRAIFYSLSFIGIGLRNPNFRVYHGSCWFCVNNDLVSILTNPCITSKYNFYFRNSVCSDESYFQTIIMNETDCSDVKDYLVYVDWSLGGPNPKTLDRSDFDRLLNSDKLVARKFDSSIDNLIIQMIADQIKMK